MAPEEIRRRFCKYVHSLIFEQRNRNNLCMIRQGSDHLRRISVEGESRDVIEMIEGSCLEAWSHPPSVGTTEAGKLAEDRSVLLEATSRNARRRSHTCPLTLVERLETKLRALNENFKSFLGARSISWKGLWFPFVQGARCTMYSTPTVNVTLK